MNPIYLDNAATTPLDPRVFEAMVPWLSDNFGNASSAHQLGQKASVAVENAREIIAQNLGCEPAEIVFTSGGTESNNSVIHGVPSAIKRTKIVTTNAEHHAVIHPIQHAKSDIEGIFSPILTNGLIDSNSIIDSIDDTTALVSVMLVNNESGVINPIKEIAEKSHQAGALFHSDTVQAIGKIDVKVDDLGLDFLSISAHKFYGPKGVGALYIRGGSEWNPFMEGGSQERRRRGGTLNVAGIVGLGKALELAVSEMKENQNHIQGLKERLVGGLKSRFGTSVSFNGNPDETLYNIVNATFLSDSGDPFDGEMLLLNLDMENICVSSGSACTSGAIEASHVLLAMGRPELEARSSLRFSMGKFNTESDIDTTLDKLEMVLQRMQRKK